MTTGRTRNAVSDSMVREIALRVIAEEGVDRTTVPRIAAVGEFSPAVVYRRYDSGIDAILEVWTAELAPHFQRLMRAAPLLADGNRNGGLRSGEATWLAQELTSPSLPTRAAINVLAASRRLAAIGDDIRAQVESDLNTVTATDTALPPVMATAQLLPVLGALLLAPLAPRLPEIVLAQFGRFSAEYANRDHWFASSADHVYAPPPPLVIATGNPTLDDLHNAALRVIVRYGYDNATATRITRESRRSLTSAYRQVGNKDELLLSAVAAALNSDLGLSGTETSTAMSFSKADRLQRALQATLNQIDDRNRSNRALVLELILAARTDAAVGAVLNSWFSSVGDRFGSFAAQVCPNNHDELASRWFFRISAGVGAMLLSLVVPRFITRFDPMPIISANDAVAVETMTAGARPAATD